MISQKELLQGWEWWIASEITPRMAQTSAVTYLCERVPQVFTEYGMINSNSDGFS